MRRGETLAGYTLEERIGVGGMAEVFRARREGPGGFAKQVAIKRVLPDLGRDPKWVAMFFDEARLAARFSSRNLVQVFDFGEAEGTYYLVMEYVDGVDLATLLSRAPPSLECVAYVGSELCEALDHLHSATGEDGSSLGIVHRDVTPANVLLSANGEVKLGDFGIAKERARSARTGDGAIKGKLAYLSPEQVRHDDVDARTDLYALGLCLFEALAGTRYLEADSELESLRLAEHPPIHRIDELDQPAAVVETLRRMLDPEPTRRFPSAHLLADALEAWGEPLTPAQARREIVELVKQCRGEAAGDRMSSRDADARSTLPGEDMGASPGEARRRAANEESRTEVRDVLAERRPWRPAVIGGILLALFAVAAYQLWPRAEPTRVADAAAPAVLSNTAADADWPQRELADARSAGMVVDAAASSADARQKRPYVRPQLRADAGARVVDAGERPGDAARPADAAASPEQAQAARSGLGAIEQALAARGLLPSDVPGLFRRRARLAARVAAGQAPLAALRALEREIGAFAIDRSFIDAKLQRLNRELRARDLEPAAKSELEQHVQRALSYSVNGRYDLANRELNAIAKAIEP